MDGIVIVGEALHEGIRPLAMQFAEALAHVAVKFAVCPLLRTTLHNHVAKLDVLPLRYLKLEKLVDAFLEIERRHDGKVDGSAEVDQVRLRSVVNLQLFLSVILVCLFAFI